MVLGTGMGKTKTTIDIIDRLLESNPSLKLSDIYLFTSEKTLRDENWINEFKKFGREEWVGKVNSECYQSAYKWRGRNIPVAVMDEVDFMVTDEYFKLIEENSFDVMLCMTGFLPAEKEDILSKYAPVFYRYSTQDGQADGLLNKSRFVFVEFPLSNVPLIPIKKKDGTVFYQSENDMYRYFEREIRKCFAEIRELTIETVKFDLLGPSENKEKIDSTKSKIKTKEGRLKYFTRTRREFLLSLESSRTAAKNIISSIMAADGRNKVIVFSRLTKQSEEICAYTFNGKNMKNNTNIEKLNTGEIKVLGLCKALGRGQNFVGVNYVVRESYDGSDVDLNQTHGRLTRLPLGDVATYIVLIPTYKDRVIVNEGGKKIPKQVTRYTQSINWANRMMSSFQTGDISRINISNINKITCETQI